VISSNRLVSCSNDGQILVWEIEELPGGNEIKAIVISKYEDSDYVYSLAVFPSSLGTAGWVSSGENTGIKIFKNDGKVRNIQDCKIPLKLNCPLVLIRKSCKCVDA
jgi:hypothetical protein